MKQEQVKINTLPAAMVEIARLREDNVNLQEDNVSLLEDNRSLREENLKQAQELLYYKPEFWTRKVEKKL
jgi:hypothetical protein